MSEAYTSFAAVYDTFMDETPYAEWCEYLAELLNEYGMIQLPEDENLRTEANCILDLGADRDAGEKGLRYDRYR